jgi:hypothetical protein
MLLRNFPDNLDGNVSLNFHVTISCGLLCNPTDYVQVYETEKIASGAQQRAVESLMKEFRLDIPQYMHSSGTGMQRNILMIRQNI